jgi:predicted aconitase/predicted aconitase with swiveling domain
VSPNLTPGDSAALRGDRGEATGFAMQILVAFARAVGASALIDITRAHIDGCLYHGQVSLDFVERMVAGGGRVRVPTTLNVGALDLIHPELVRLPEREQAPARRLMRAHEELGCVPSFTCAPYQSEYRPSFGEQIAWGESNAIVFANSVIGARTNRYGDFIDLCCALTGRAPAWGLHLDENRRGQILFELAGFPASQQPTDTLFVAVGLLVGSLSGDRVPVIDGLPAPRSEDQLKALGAAAASSGAVGLFHAVGITPEARTRADAFGSATPERTISIRPADVARALERLSTVPDGSPISAVCLGTPHFSRDEWDRFLPLLREAAPSRGVPIYVNTARATLQALEAEGRLAGLDAFNLKVVTDTCTYLTPIVEHLDGAVMTNSGKWAYYAPANLGAQVAFGELEDCLASAAAGRVVRVTRPPSEAKAASPKGARARSARHARESLQPPRRADARRGSAGGGAPAHEKMWGPTRIEGMQTEACATGEAEAPALVLTETLSLWGGVDVETGRIIDHAHPDRGRSIAGTILVMPGGRGSSSSSAVLAEAIRRGTGPAGIILAVPDPILTVGALVAQALYGIRIPIVVGSIEAIRTGDRLRVRALDGRDAGIEHLNR